MGGGGREGTKIYNFSTPPSELPNCTVLTLAKSVSDVISSKKKYAIDIQSNIFQNFELDIIVNFFQNMLEGSKQ